MDNNSLSLAFDFGGTKLAAGLVNTRDGTIIDHRKNPTPSQKGAKASLAKMVQMGKSLIEHNPGFHPIHIGVSFGGSVSKDRKSIGRSIHIHGWDQFPITDYLGDIFRLPVFLDNDANAAALGEWTFGAGKKAASMLYIQLSTGVGSGIIIDGKIWRGEGLGAEFGHVKVNGWDTLCVCGQKGCIESIASGWALKDSGQQLLNRNPVNQNLNLLCKGDIEKIDARILFSSMRQGDYSSAQIINNAFEALGIALANAIVIMDPSVVVLGGGLCKSKDSFSSILDESLKKYLLSAIYKRLCIRYSFFEGKETLVGAALLDL